MTTDICEKRAMEWTGERMVPEGADAVTFWEHIYRYRFAIPYTRGHKVLDIACGEGYGAAALVSSGALSVCGVDISEEACAHARDKYGLNAMHGSAELIPIANSTVDIITSFETVEHVQDPSKFILECHRVLKPNGRLIISTPNPKVYSNDYKNPFHCSEMDLKTFMGILTGPFTSFRVFTQKPDRVAWWSPRRLTMYYSSHWTWPVIGRIACAVRNRLRLPFLKEPLPSLRDDPIAAILDKDSNFSSPFNPYAVRRHASWHREEPRYYVIVCRRA